MFKIITIIALISNMLLANNLTLNTEEKFNGYIMDNKIKINKKPLNVGVFSSYILSNNVNLLTKNYDNVLTKYTTGNEPYDCSIPINLNNGHYEYSTCICQSLNIDIKAHSRFYELSISKFKSKSLSNIDDDIFYDVCFENAKVYHPVYNENEKSFIIENENIICEELSDTREQSNLNFDLSKCTNKTTPL